MGYGSGTAAIASSKSSVAALADHHGPAGVLSHSDQYQDFDLSDRTVRDDR